MVMETKKGDSKHEEPPDYALLIKAKPMGQNQYLKPVCGFELMKIISNGVW
jgi:hypothetical protein